LNPLVTVIVPNYNHAKYLPARMEGILNQTFRNFEVIILDDCSTDGSREIIESYRSREQVSHIIFNEINSGSPFRQWNKGIEMAKGEFIWVAESDDNCKSNFLDLTVEKMREYSSVGLVYTQSLEVDEISGTEYLSFQDSPRFKKAFQSSYFATGNKEIAEKLIHENTIPNASGVLFRKSVYQKTGGADESMKLCGDWFLWTKMLLISDIYYIAEPLNIFRLTSHSVRNRYSKVQTFHERLRILNWMDKNGVKKVREKELILVKSLFNNFKLHELKKPVKMVRMESLTGNKTLIMLEAFLMSIVDRMTGKISRIQDRITS